MDFSLLAPIIQFSTSLKHIIKQGLPYFNPGQRKKLKTEDWVRSISEGLPGGLSCWKLPNIVGSKNVSSRVSLLHSNQKRIPCLLAMKRPCYHFLIDLPVFTFIFSHLMIIGNSHVKHTKCFQVYVSSKSFRSNWKYSFHLSKVTIKPFGLRFSP